jgi:NAD(P)-dependent dehydrogenase (short-subunit alcohol dehydrogenase family)
VTVDELDLSDLDSVRTFADPSATPARDWTSLINNAAVMACPETRPRPGWELQFATNHPATTRWSTGSPTG